MSLLFNALSRMLCPIKSQRSRTTGDGRSGLGAQGPLGRGRHRTAGLLEEEEGGESTVTPSHPPALVLYPGLLAATIVAGRRAPSNSWRQLGSPKSTRGRSREGPVCAVAGHCALVACASHGGTQRCHFHPTLGPRFCGKSWRPTGFAHVLPLSFVGRSTPGTHSYPFRASLAPFQSLNPEIAEQQHGPIPVQESGVCPPLPGRCQFWAGCLRRVGCQGQKGGFGGHSWSRGLIPGCRVNPHYFSSDVEIHKLFESHPFQLLEPFQPHPFAQLLRLRYSVDRSHVVI